MKIILIHGISNDRPGDWGRKWLHVIRPLLPASVSKWHTISWEKLHEQKYKPSPWSIRNLLQDLGAINNAAVLHHLTDSLKSIQGNGEPVWLIAHSIGSALAYQALDWLQTSPSRFHVDRLVTVGSPLWMPYSRILRTFSSLSIVMPKTSTLDNVTQWIDVQGYRDPIAGFALVRQPFADVRLRCSARHPFAYYARSSAFRKALSQDAESRGLPPPHP